MIETGGQRRQFEPIHIGPLLREFPGIVETHVRGKRSVGKDWPLNATFLLPMMETISGVRTPSNFLPPVSAFYNYIRGTDDFLDNSVTLPSFEDAITKTKPLYDNFLESIKSVLSPKDIDYMITQIGLLQQSAYEAVERQHSWIESPSYEEAYDYRWDTTGRLSDVVGELWCFASGVTGEPEKSARRLVQRVGMFFQFQDDLIDVHADKDTDGNLLRAILNEEGEKEVFFNSLVNRSKAPVIAAMRSYTPKSLQRLFKSMGDESVRIREESPRVANFLDSFASVSLPMIRV